MTIDRFVAERILQPLGMTDSFYLLKSKPDDPRKARVVEMKFFAGMTNKEAASALGTSDATVERDWKMARAWLIQAMNAGNASVE